MQQVLEAIKQQKILLVPKPGVTNSENGIIYICRSINYINIKH